MKKNMYLKEELEEIYRNTEPESIKSMVDRVIPLLYFPNFL